MDSVIDELAKNTYNRIFADIGENSPSPYFQRTPAGIDKLVEGNLAILETALQRKVFLYKLIRITKDDKINLIQEQKRKYGVVLLANFEYIEALYQWLNDLVEDDNFLKNIGENSTVETSTPEKLGKTKAALKTFGYIGDIDKLKNCLREIDIKIDLIDSTNCVLEDLFIILLSKDLTTEKKSIYIGCDTAQFSFVISLLSKHFKGSLVINIELSNRFFSKTGTTFKANNLHQAKKKSPMPKLFDEIEKVFKKYY